MDVMVKEANEMDVMVEEVSESKDMVEEASGDEDMVEEAEESEGMVEEFGAGNGWRATARTHARAPSVASGSNPVAQKHCLLERSHRLSILGAAIWKGDRTRGMWWAWWWWWRRRRR